MNTDLMFSSTTDQWATPQDFFDKLDEEFHFTLDAAADETNHKCEKYYDKQMDGLSQPWATPEREREREYGVIHRMVVRLVNGLKKHIMNHSMARRLLCFFLREQTQSGFMILFMAKLKLDLCGVD